MLLTWWDWRRYTPDGGGAGGTNAGTGGTPNPAQGGNTGTPPAGDGQNTGTPPTPRTWDVVIAALPEVDRALYEQHTTGLRNTVQATRQERDARSLK